MNNKNNLYFETVKCLICNEKLFDYFIATNERWQFAVGLTRSDSFTLGGNAAFRLRSLGIPLVHRAWGDRRAVITCVTNDQFAP